MDGINWSSVLSDGNVKVFPANNDSHTLVTNTLAGNVVAKFIRIISVSGTNYHSMRLEVKGCPVLSICGCCAYDLVSGPYGVSNDALSASSTHSTCLLQEVRFNSSRGWCPADTGDGHYIQVEFQTTSNLKAIQTLGRGNNNQWVSLYSVNISMDGINWNSILTNGDIKVFPANSDRHTLVTNKLAGNVVAKYIRVISVSGEWYRSMRLEVKGCPVTNMSGKCPK
ncbi:lactadherin-like [Argopecten irradians]|uniref:lactadherin-like n=1 Tax=Argopecten irradians TaxID=31199 RepID=UPI00371AF63B